MRRVTKANLPAVALLLACALAGCGGGSSSTSPTASGNLEARLSPLFGSVQRDTATSVVVHADGARYLVKQYESPSTATAVLAHIKALQKLTHKPVLIATKGSYGVYATTGGTAPFTPAQRRDFHRLTDAL